ncbi:MAG: twin-arginine translocation signal domain-containing protein [Gemmatimonadaceae bacterium]
MLALLQSVGDGQPYAGLDGGQFRFNVVQGTDEGTMPGTFSRRHFLGACSAVIAGLVLPVQVAWAGNRGAGPHPTPRPGITGEKVLTKAQLEGKPKLITLFAAVREIPEVIDGIYCNCGCTNPPEFYSLLSCYEGKGMARDCGICQGQGRLAVRLHKEGRTLDEIRAAVDAKFG